MHGALESVFFKEEYIIMESEYSEREREEDEKKKK